jgi:3-hydroxyisobutyrate dehydrogenase
MPTTIAVLGMGRMGDAIAHKILAAGFAVRVWNRTPQRAAAAVAAGATAARTPADAVAEADIVVTMLTDGMATASVIAPAGGGALDAMPRGCTWIQMGTIGPTWTDLLAAGAAASGIAFVDAPVSGSDQAARAGDLLVLASGPEAVHGVVAPVFEAIGRRTLWLGEAGAGSRLKLALNNWLACVVEGLAETLALTSALGLDPHRFLDAVADGPLAAPYAITKGRAMLAGDASPGFALRDAVKDVVMARSAASDEGLELPLTDALLERWSPAAADGLGDRDVSAVVRLAGHLRVTDSTAKGTQMHEPPQDTRDLPRGSFADGQADPDEFPEDARLGRFGDGEAPPIGDEEAGRFSEGVEARGDDEPEKHVEGTFGDEESPEDGSS